MERAGEVATVAADTLVGWGEGRPHWYALYTRTCWEKRIAGVLQAQEIEVYLPTSRVWSRDRSRRTEAPVFPGYLFVRCQLTKETWLAIKKTSGVVRILGTDTRPIPIPDHEIDSLMKCLALQDNIEGHPRLRKGDTVQVVRGPLQGVIGTLVEVARNRHKLIVSIDLINRAVATRIDASLVEPYHP